MYRYFQVILLIILLLNTYNVNGASLISNSNCLIGYAEPKSNDVLEVMTIPQSCYTNCNKYCLEKFKLFSDQSNGSISTFNNTTSLMNAILLNNQDRLQSCMTSCYSGKRFDTKIRIPMMMDQSTGKILDDTGDIPYTWKCDIFSNATKVEDLSCNTPANGPIDNTSSLCAENELNTAFFSSATLFKSGNQASVSLANTTSTNNKVTLNPIIGTANNTIYLCGFKTLFFSPEYFVGKYSFKGKYPTTNIFSPLENAGTVNTGIKVKNGDYINIQYMGRYNSSYISDPNKPNYQDYKLDILVGQTKIDFDVSPYQLNDYDETTRNNQSQKCNDTCSSDYSNAICTSLECGYYNDNGIANKYGLDVNTFWMTSPSLFLELETSSNKIYKYPQFRQTILNGILNNIGDTPQDLIIRYPNANNQSQGGYFVSIEWRGCQYTNGERLQYTIVNNALTNSNNFNLYMASDNGPHWKDLNIKTVNNTLSSIIDIDSDSLEIPTQGDFNFENDTNVMNGLEQDKSKYQGKIFFKIKTLDQSEVSGINTAEISRANTSGSYNLKVVNLTVNEAIYNIIINTFVESLNKIPQNIFNGFMNSLEYITIIRLLLIFYIAFTGFTFMAGLAQISQQEAVIRIFKISIIILLMSENSFKFFNDYFFNAFNFKVIDFFANAFTPEIDIQMAPGLKINTGNCFAPGVPLRIFCLFEQDLRILFRWDFWSRIIGLAFSGFFLGVIGIVIGIILYLLVSIKVIGMYCIALITMTITISLSPIFIPLVLFKYTKIFFDSWIKQLLVIILQPMFVFLSISLFRAIFILLIQSLMGNVSCSMCWIDFSWWCLSLYLPLSLNSSPSFISFPMANLSMLLSIYFIGCGMYYMSTHAAKMSINLISFSLYNLNDTSVSGQAYFDLRHPLKSIGKNLGYFGEAPSVLLSSLSLDKESRDARENFRQRRIDKEEFKRYKKNNQNNNR